MQREKDGKIMMGDEDCTSLWRCEDLELLTNPCFVVAHKAGPVNNPLENRQKEIPKPYGFGIILQ